MERMTIHRALSELKIINARIEKTIESLNPTGITQRDQVVGMFKTVDEFSSEAKSNLQSVNDLIDRKNKIKSAIVEANGKTSVDVNGKKMTIADAINYKQIIIYKKKIVETIAKKHVQALKGAEHHNNQIEQNALRLAESALQKDNVKINDGDAVAITEPYIAKNKFEILDPLKAEKLVQSMEEEIYKFESEVDSVLSEINAVTKIEI